MTVFWNGVFTTYIIRAIITLKMEAASSFKTYVNVYQTTRLNNPEDNHLLIKTIFTINSTQSV